MSETYINRQCRRCGSPFVAHLEQRHCARCQVSWLDRDKLQQLWLQEDKGRAKTSLEIDAWFAGWQAREGLTK